VSQGVARAPHRAPWHCKGVGLGSILHSTWHHWLVPLNGTRDSDPTVFRFVCAMGRVLSICSPLHLPWYYTVVVVLGSILHSNWYLVPLNGTRDSDPYVFSFVCARGEGAVNMPLYLRDADLVAAMVSLGSPLLLFVSPRVSSLPAARRWTTRRRALCAGSWCRGVHPRCARGPLMARLLQRPPAQSGCGGGTTCGKSTAS
jgi:hypothetical protein